MHVMLAAGKRAVDEMFARQHIGLHVVSHAMLPVVLHAMLHVTLDCA